MKRAMSLQTFFWILLMAISLLLRSEPAAAQQTARSRQALEREKRENMERIGQLRNILKQTASQKRVSLGQLRALEQQIQAQSKQINLLTEDLELSEKEIKELRAAGAALSEDLDKLKAEYAGMIYKADKRRQQMNPLGFLFSSESFNQVVARYRYLKQYAGARQTQKRQMEAIQLALQEKQSATERKRRQQRGTLKTKVNESKKLSGLKNEQGQVVKQLGTKEEQLRAELAESRRAVNRLENMITAIIAREARERAERLARERAERERLARLEAARKAEAERRRAEAVAAAEKAGKPAPPPEPEPERPAPKPERKMSALDEEEVALASSFAASRARLPWPVQRGFVSERFGTHPHPVLKGIQVNNPGIDIQTNAGETVRSVYEGIVRNVEFVMGSNNVVAVQHGPYYTIYAKLKSVSVRVGQRVKAREPIGVVATNSQGVSEVQFQIWKEFAKQNPESWLVPR